MNSFVGKELTSSEYTFTLKDEDGVAIPSASLAALILTLKDVATSTVINLRTAQNVLNADNVTVHATSGLVTWKVQPLDMVISNTYQLQERHRATFTATTTASPAVKLNHEVTIYVENFADAA